MSQWTKPPRGSLLWMAEKNRWEGLQELLLQRADVDPVTPQRLTPLMMAAERGQVDVVQALIAAGAGVNKTNGFCMSVLMYGRQGGIHVLKMLLDAGAEVNYPGSSGWTVLLDAVRTGTMDQVELLLQRGADIQQTDHYRNSCLIMAAAIQNSAAATEMVLYLLKAGADPTVRSHRAPYSTPESPFAVTAADVARCTGKESLAELLQRHQEEWERPFVLTVSAAPAVDGIELTCRAISGNIAATLLWPQIAPNSALKEAIVTAVEASFDCPIKPLRVSNLRLVKPDATMLRLGRRDPPLAEQLLGPQAAPTAFQAALDFLFVRAKAQAT